ncbi:MAG TPA: tetratricopeptide repeat protein [Cyclobacteriaceae bacterium]|nr:tetratricopeptide repeat protein [Cyclobacteriaceae bacterium]
MICRLLCIIICLSPLRALAQLSDTTEIRNCINKANYYWEHNLDSSLYFVKRGNDIAIRIGYPQGVADIAISWGGYHWFRSEFAEAIGQYTHALEVSEASGYSKGVSIALSSLGMVYSKLGDYPRAIEYYLQGLKLGLHTKNRILTLNSLGVAYRKSNNPEAAHSAFLEALNLKPAPATRAGILSNLGLVAFVRQEYDKAMTFQQQALTTFDSVGSTRGVITCCNNITEILLAQKKYTEAASYADKALTLSARSKLPNGQVNAMQGQAAVNMAQGEYQQASKILLEAAHLAVHHHLMDEKMKVYRALATCYQQTGQLPAAYRYLDRYNEVRDSTLSQETNSKITNLRIEYEVSKREKDIELLKKQSEIDQLNRNIVIGIAASLTLLAVVVSVYQYGRVRKNRELLTQSTALFETRQQLMQTELENQRLLQSELEQQVEKKSRELTTHALNMLQKNEMLEELKSRLASLSQEHNNLQPDVQKVISGINLSFHQDHEWKKFQAHFDQIHAGFNERLTSRYPDLSGNDLKMCSLIKLNLGTKEIASILGISAESVKMARYRLRKKLQIEPDQQLVAFLGGF